MLVFRSLNGRSGRRYGLAATGDRRRRSAATVPTTSSSIPYGLLTPGQIFAIMAQRHMLDYGTTEKELGHIAVTCRARANANPAAQMHDRPLTMDDYLAARMISRPLRLFDFCLETDGACAVIVTTAARAADCGKPPALIRAVAQGSGSVTPAGRPVSRAHARLHHHPARPGPWPTPSTDGPASGPPTSTSPSSTTASRSRCCCSSRTTASAPRARAARSRRAAPSTSAAGIPINTGGGHLSEGYIHGMNHIVEGVRQMRGESTSQVPGAEVCLVTSTPAAARQRPDPASGVMNDTPLRLIPVDDDRDTGGFWDGRPPRPAGVRVCDRCATVLHMPRAYCRACGSWDGHWQPSLRPRTALLVDDRGAPGPPRLSRCRTPSCWSSSTTNRWRG